MRQGCFVLSVSNLLKEENWIQEQFIELANKVFSLKCAVLNFGLKWYGHILMSQRWLLKHWCRFQPLSSVRLHFPLNLAIIMKSWNQPGVTPKITVALSKTNSNIAELVTWLLWINNFLYHFLVVMLHQGFRKIEGGEDCVSNKIVVSHAH